MKKAVLVSFLCMLVCISCQKNEIILPPLDDGLRKFTYSRQDSLEGGDFALWFEGKLLATDSTKSRLMHSLKYLRQLYTDSVAIYPSIKQVLNSRFQTPWRIGQLPVKFDSATAIQVKAHQYTGWNTLDPAVRPDTILDEPDVLGWALLGFGEPYNPIRLAQIYQTLPGVFNAEPNGIFHAGGDFPIFPGLTENEMTYVFVANYLWAPGPYLYFRYVRGKPIYFGQWSNSMDPRPTWWSDAKRNVDSFYVWSGY